MSKNQNQTGPSTEDTTTDVAVIDNGADDGLDDDVRAAVERASNFVVERGYGANTTKLIQYIAARSVDEADLNAVITEQLTARLLAATTAEDILVPFDPEKGEAYFGRPIIIHGATFIESDYEGFPWYVSLEFTEPGKDDKRVLTIGGEKIIMQVAAAEANNLLPLYCRIHKSTKATKNGFYPLDLRPMTDIG